MNKNVEQVTHLLGLCSISKLRVTQAPYQALNVASKKVSLLPPHRQFTPASRGQTDAFGVFCVFLAAFGHICVIYKKSPNTKREKEIKEREGKRERSREREKVPFRGRRARLPKRIMLHASKHIGRVLSQIASGTVQTSRSLMVCNLSTQPFTFAQY